jgi:large subunit ribosomal protein L4e
MKTQIYEITGKEKEKIELPSCFSERLRLDLISKVIESRKKGQPYAPSPVAGRQHSASGIIQHRRHVWKTAYGKGISRVPRKIMSVRGTQFNWVAAEIPSVRGGRRAFPPRIESRMGESKINKKEMKLALASAISANSKLEFVLKKYETLNEKEVSNLPIVSESKILSLKTKDLLSSIKNILGKNLFEIAIQSKSIRAGRGKMRGRKYKKNAGLLLVIGKDEEIKTNLFDTTNVNNLGVNDLCKGGIGRITLYTENAIKELGEKFK